MNVDGSNIFVGPTYPLYFGVGNDKFDKRVIYLIKHFLKHRFKKVVEDLVADAIKENDVIEDAVSESVGQLVEEALSNSETISSLVESKVQNAVNVNAVIRSSDFDNPEKQFATGTLAIWNDPTNEKYTHGFMYEKTEDGWIGVNTMNVIR